MFCFCSIFGKRNRTIAFTLRSADTLGKLAVRAQEVGVNDAERIIPGWKADGNPFVIREHFSRDGFSPEIVDRLDCLCESESGNEKVMPLVSLLWKGFGE
jgi:hypothetical protein